MGSKPSRPDGSAPDPPVSDGPLWGRSEYCVASLKVTLTCFRRTLVGSKQRSWRTWRRSLRSFRRTLVGSKHRHGDRASPRVRVSDGPLWGRSSSPSDLDGVAAMFQTDPCGVEADRPHLGRLVLCLVSDGPLWGRSSEWLPDVLKSLLVSDGPLWGRSLLIDGGDVLKPGFQTDPCGVEARLPER